MMQEEKENAAVELTRRETLAKDLRDLADMIEATDEIDQVTLAYRVGKVDGVAAEPPVYVSHIWVDSPDHALVDLFDLVRQPIRYLMEDLEEAQNARRSPEV